ncbi:hypothetical protein RFI_24712 [Reticulomyxa filosa]|uniref:Uncharacterized protein n=1 Tax=Reticulomyxa filosa TaxID=46433 RepID=X6MHX3_RETFI|nr:hypothetical protein RFI_24712 [Reticulomyxa filosa]|eukprot:ETO12665.1 hypothetical protein RFI_24712 [Reticulomyxa filosa]
MNKTQIVYWCKDHHCVLIQQRSQIRLGGQGEYVKHLMDWIKQQEFRNTIVLTSDFATRRAPQQIAKGLTQVYYCHTSAKEKDVLPTAHQTHTSTTQTLEEVIQTQFQWHKSLLVDTKKGNRPTSMYPLLEDRDDDRKHASEENKYNDGENSPDLCKIAPVGGGITKKLFNACKENDQSITVISQYSCDGDNSPEAFSMLLNLVALLEKYSNSC